MEIILIGSSKILYTCAEVIRDYYGAEKTITIFDTDFSKLNRRYESLFDIHAESRSEMMAELEKIECDTILVSVNNRYLIPKNVIDNPHLTLINLHHALLPAHRGRNAEAWTIFDGDETGGITWHYIEPGIDTGAILQQASVKITDDMRSIDLLKECGDLIVQTLPDLLPFEELSKKECRPQTDLHESSKQLRYSTQIPADGYADPDWPAVQLSRFLRCMDYGVKYPLGRPRLIVGDKEMVIHKYTITSCEPAAEKSVHFHENGSGVTVMEHDLRIEMYLRDLSPQK